MWDSTSPAHAAGGADGESTWAQPAAGGEFRVKVGSQGTAAAPRRLGPAGTACPLPAPPSGWDGPQPTPNVSKGLSDGSGAASRENRHLVARAVGLV